MISTNKTVDFSGHMQRSIDSFISRVNALSGNLPVHTHIALKLYLHVNDRFQDFLDLHCKVAHTAKDDLERASALPSSLSDGESGQVEMPTSSSAPSSEGAKKSSMKSARKSGNESGTEYTVPIDKTQTFRVFSDELDRLEIVCKTMPELALIALVSQFDVYLANLIRGILLKKPDILNASERAISYSDLSDFSSIEEARDFFAEKTIEGVLRQSHTDQFAWLEEKLGLKLRNGLDVWSRFIEITQRRNLFVHTDGIVTRQYLDECAADVVDADIRRGAQLDVSPNYISAARNVVLEVGVKLGYVIWKSLAKNAEDDELADNHLNDVSVDLIQRKDLELALKLLSFPQEKAKPKFSSQLFSTLYSVNKALIYSRQKKKKDVDAVIASIEWRILSENFQMAKLVLQEDFEGAAMLMRRLGPQSSVVSELDYLQWPILEEFRKTESFRTAFREVFERGFTEFSPQEFKSSVYGSLKDVDRKKANNPAEQNAGDEGGLSESPLDNKRDSTSLDAQEMEGAESVEEQDLDRLP